MPDLTRMSITRWLDNIIRRKKTRIFFFFFFLGGGGGGHCMVGQIMLHPEGVKIYQIYFRK